MASGRTTQTGQRGSYAGGHGPVGEATWRRRPGKTTFRIPGASAVRVVSSKIANSHIYLGLSLSLSQNFVSRPKFRVPLEIPSPARSSYLDPSLQYFFCFVMTGDAVAMVNQ